MDAERRARLIEAKVQIENARSQIEDVLAGKRSRGDLQQLFNQIQRLRDNAEVRAVAPDKIDTLDEMLNVGVEHGMAARPSKDADYRAL